MERQCQREVEYLDKNLPHNRYVYLEFQAANYEINKVRRLKTSELGHDLSLTSLCTHRHTHTHFNIDACALWSKRCNGRRLYLYIRGTAGSCVTLRPGSAHRSLGATCQQRLRQTFKWYMWARQGLRRHAGRHNEAHLIKSLRCSKLMNFQIN